VVTGYVFNSSRDIIYKGEDMNIPAWVWAWLGTTILALLSGKVALGRFVDFLKAVDELMDIPIRILESYQNDDKITPNEIKDIEQEIAEFRAALDKLRGKK